MLVFSDSPFSPPWIHVDMRTDVQNIFMHTPHSKQVMMFSATLSKEIRPVCRKFCQDVGCCVNYLTPMCSHINGGGRAVSC